MSDEAATGRMVRVAATPPESASAYASSRGRRSFRRSTCRTDKRSCEASQVMARMRIGPVFSDRDPGEVSTNFQNG